MFNVLRERLQQKFRTAPYPDEPAPPRPERFRGLPLLNADKCPEGCSLCADACPTDSVKFESGQLSLDMGRCLFCVECLQACPEGAIEFTNDYRISVRTRDDLVLRGQPVHL